MTILMPNAAAPSYTPTGIPTGDVELVVNDMTNWLRRQLVASGQRRFVVGLSGGIDSAVVATLAFRAVGPERILLVAMPYGAHSAPASRSLADAKSLVDGLNGIEGETSVPFLTIDIASRVDAAWSDLCGAMSGVLLDEDLRPVLVDGSQGAALVRGNLKARERAVTLRGLANMTQGLVLGTENRTENLLGYFTIGGDEETDLEVLSPFFKGEVRQIAAALGVPDAIINKAPSADLWDGQTDEGELGVTYDEADAVLRALCNGVPTDGIVASTGVSEEAVAKVLAKHEATAFKRAPRPNYPGLQMAANNRVGHRRDNDSGPTIRSLGWVVDAQNDFLRPPSEGGRLYVHDLAHPDRPGAARIIPQLAATVAALREQADLVVFTGDWHGSEDDEIDAIAPNPANGTYPPHCMGRSENPDEIEGAWIHAAVAPVGGYNRVLPWDASKDREEKILARLAVACLEVQRSRAEGVPALAPALFVQKNKFDVFAGNSRIRSLLESLPTDGSPSVTLCGVASDVCVNQAIDGLQKHLPKWRLRVVRDAIAGLGIESDESCARRWKANGVVVADFSELLHG